MGHIRVRVVANIHVPDSELPDYEATTIEEATRNQEKWFNQGAISLNELTEFSDHTVSFEAIP